MRLGKKERVALREKIAIRNAAKMRASMAYGPHMRSVWDNMSPRGKPSKLWGFVKGGMRPKGAQV